MDIPRNTTWIGNVTDDVLGTAVTGNESVIFAQVTDGGLFDLSTGMLNNTTGGYNFSIAALNSSFRRV